MSNSKQQKERDKAIRHLFDFIDKSEKWSPRVEEMTNHFIELARDSLGRDEDSMKRLLQHNVYSPMIYDFLMELMATTSWNNERLTPIDDYLKQRGWREGTHGRRYLNALNESELHFLEVTEVEPGSWVEVRPFDTNVPTERIIERSGSEGLYRNEAFVARLVKLGKSHRLGSILPMSPSGANHLKNHLDAIEDDLKALYEGAVAEDGPEGLVKNFTDSIDYERRIRIEETGFICFISDVLNGHSMGAPQLAHADASAPAMPTTESIDVGQHPELQGVMQEMMKKHYLKTLDEAIPMLDNESPRACAADPNKQHKVIDWLKYLEITDSNSPNPAQDFTWMWEELGLSDRR